jgi:hypothetical protein
VRNSSRASPSLLEAIDVLVHAPETASPCWTPSCTRHRPGTTATSPETTAWLHLVGISSETLAEVSSPSSSYSVRPICIWWI